MTSLSSMGSTWQAVLKITWQTFLNCLAFYSPLLVLCQSQSIMVQALVQYSGELIKRCYMIDLTAFTLYILQSGSSSWGPLWWICLRLSRTALSIPGEKSIKCLLQPSLSNARGWFIKFCLMCIKPRLDESNSHHFAFDNSMTQFLRRIYIWTDKQWRADNSS